MTGSTPQSVALRIEVETAIIDAVERLGPDGVSRIEVLRPFMKRGVHRASLYRWYDEYLESGKPGQHITKQVRAAVQARAERAAEAGTDVMDEAAAELQAMLPDVLRPEDLIGGADTAIDIMAKLRTIIAGFEQLVAHSKTTDGKIRNARLLIASLAELRKTLETAVRFHEAMFEVSQVERMHEAMIAEIRMESAELAERVLRRMAKLAAAWG
jgi:hypothetical protein